MAKAKKGSKTSSSASSTSKESRNKSHSDRSANDELTMDTEHETSPEKDVRTPEAPVLVYEKRKSLYPTPKTLTKMSGLVFNVYLIRKMLRKGKYAKRIFPGAAVYMTAVIEYLVSEMLEISGTAAIENKRHFIKPRHILLAVKNDDELNQLLEHVTFPSGGVKPFINPVLLPKPTKRRKSTAERDSNEF